MYNSWTCADNLAIMPGQGRPTWAGVTGNKSRRGAYLAGVRMSHRRDVSKTEMEMKYATSRSIRAAALVLTVLAAGACSDDPIGPREATDVEFDAALGVDLDAMERLPTGTYIQILQEGEGLNNVNGDVTVSYTLWLSGGTQVDQSNSFSFELDAGEVIDGFNDGVKGMRINETRLIVIPSAEGYGPAVRTGIPAHSVLVFRVVLLDATSNEGPS